MSVSDQLDAPKTAARDGDVRAQEAPRGESNVTSAYVTIAKPAQELYDFWRDFSNLPQVMENRKHRDRGRQALNLDGQGTGRPHRAMGVGRHRRSARPAASTGC